MDKITNNYLSKHLLKSSRTYLPGIWLNVFNNGLILLLFRASLVDVYQNVKKQKLQKRKDLLLPLSDSGQKHLRNLFATYHVSVYKENFVTSRANNKCLAN